MATKIHNHYKTGEVEFISHGVTSYYTQEAFSQFLRDNEYNVNGYNVYLNEVFSSEGRYIGLCSNYKQE